MTSKRASFEGESRHNQNPKGALPDSVEVPPVELSPFLVPLSVRYPSLDLREVSIKTVVRGSNKRSFPASCCRYFIGTIFLLSFSNPQFLYASDYA
jgi:hypothetical protein